MHFKPLHDRVLVSRKEAKEVSKGGIVIPEAAMDKPQFGFVKAVGEGTIKEDGSIRPLNVKTGDEILFGKYSGAEIELDNEKFLIMREEDIFGIVSR